MAVGHGHSNGTQRLGASEEEHIALPIVQSSSRGVSDLFQSCFLIVTLFYTDAHSSHTHTHLTDAQLSSNPCCSTLTQLSPTQEERTKVWSRVLRNIWWDMQDVCLKIMRRRRWGDAAVYVTHMMMHLLLDLSSSPGWFCTMLTNNHAFFSFYKSISRGPIYFLKVLIKFHLSNFIQY